jgi:hypothetical protein
MAIWTCSGGLHGYHIWVESGLQYLWISCGGWMGPRMSLNSSVYSCYLSLGSVKVTGLGTPHLERLLYIDNLLGPRLGP